MKYIRFIKTNSIIIGLLVLYFSIYISQDLYFKIDLTLDKRHTLSNHTVKLLKELDATVNLKIYLEGDLPLHYRRLRKSIKEIVEQFKDISKEHINYEFINPNKYPEDKLFIELYNNGQGLIPEEIQETNSDGQIVTTNILPGITVSYNGNTIALNLLKKRKKLNLSENIHISEESLEYELTTTMRILTQKNKPKIAFIEGHNELDDYEVADITNTLSGYYDLGWINLSLYPLKMLKDYEAIIIAKPRNKIPEIEKYKIDQYIMNGGKTIWFIDQVDVNIDILTEKKTTVGILNDINIDDQLFRYGVRINPFIVQDRQSGVIPINTSLVGKEPRYSYFDFYYHPLLTGHNKHPITKNVNLIKGEFVNTIDTVGKNTNIKKTILLKTSNNTRVLKAPILIDLKTDVIKNSYINQFTTISQNVAVLLEGKFTSSFNNRILSNIDMSNKKNTSKKTKMIIIADGDIIANKTIKRGGQIGILPLGYDRYTEQTFGNKEFVTNAIYYLTDNEGWMTLKNKEYQLRLLDKVKIKNEKRKWQLINTIMPLIFILIFGLTFNFIRKKRFEKSL